MAVLVSFLLMKAVPTLLSCFAFTSFSPLFFVGSVSFSLLFVSLSVLISVVSLCRNPHDEVSSAEEDDANYNKSCSRMSSKQRNRSWWCFGEAPRGFQLTMLFLTWALLFLLLCLAPAANAESKVQLNIEQLGSFGVESETATPSVGVISEVVWKDLNQVNTAYQSSTSGASLKRQGGGGSEQKLNIKVEEQTRQQSSFHASVGLGQLGQDLQHPSDDKVELQLCGALVQTGQQVTCHPPGSPEAENRLSDIRDCSMFSSKVASASLHYGDIAVTPQLVWMPQPLYQRQVASLTIINSCNSSKLSLVAVKSDNRQFFVCAFSEKFVAPGGSLTFPVCYLPQYLGAATGRVTIETRSDPIVVQLQGEGIASPFQMHVTVHEKSHYVLSLFNPFNESIFVEEVLVSSEENQWHTTGLFVGNTDVDRVSGVPLDEIVIEAKEPSRGDEINYKPGVLMRAGATWEIPAQESRDIVEFIVDLKRGEVFRGAFQIRATGAPFGSEGGVLVYPFSSRVSKPSSVVSVPDTVDFGMLVGDQARSQPLVLENSGGQLIQVKEIYEVAKDSRITIEYKKGCVLLPGSETEVANITYRGYNQPHVSNACSSSQKIMVRTNSTIGHLMEIPYRVVVLPCLDPPALAFVPKSTMRALGDLRGSYTGQGISDLIMDYRLFLGLLFCGLMVGALVFFQAVVRETVLPTSSGDLSKGGSHRRSSSGGSPFIKRRDKLLKMWGWGALATVTEGLWAAFGSAIWRKECSASSSNYTLPRSVTPVPAPTQTGIQATKAIGGAATSASGSVPTAGRKYSSDRKNSGAAKPDQTRSGKGNAESSNSSSPLSSKDPHHHPQSIKQPKTSKFLRPGNSSAKHTICMDDLEEDTESIVKEVVAVEAIASVNAVARAQSACPTRQPPVKESPKDEVTLKPQPVLLPEQPLQTNEREKRRQRKKQVKHDVAANFSTYGGASPGSPASPVTPSRLAWSAGPPSPFDRKPTKSTSSLSDQSTAPLSPKSSGSVEHADAVPLPKIKVKVLNSLKTTNPAPVGSGTESPRRSVSSTPSHQQPRQQGRVADSRKQPVVEKSSGVGGKKGTSGECAAVARQPRKTSTSGSDKALEVTDGGHSHRGSRYPQRRGNAFAVSEVGPAALTSSASFPPRSSRPGIWTNNSAFEFGVGVRIDSLGVVPPPAIPPTLRAPGARITKQVSNAESTSSSGTSVDAGWSSLGFTSSPELPDGRLDQDLRPGSPWHSSNALSGQSSGELVYDIWGNHFGNLSQCSSHNDSSFLGAGFNKQKANPFSGFHRLLVPDHHAEILLPGSLTGGLACDMSPTTRAPFAPFSGFFSEGSTLGPEDHSRPVSPASELPDQLFSDSPIAGFTEVVPSTMAVPVAKPRVRVPYSPPMGCVAASFSSPPSTPTVVSQAAVSKASSCSFWAHDSSQLLESTLSPTISLT